MIIIFLLSCSFINKSINRDMKEFHDALSCNKISKVKDLLEKGAKVNCRFYEDKTPLMVASDPRVVKALLDRGADVNATDFKGYTAALRAYKNNNLNVLELLMKASSDQHREIIELASKENNIDALEMLVNKGVEIANRDRFLDYLLEHNIDSTPKKVELLIKLGANTDIITDQGNTLLQLAIEYNRYDILDVCLRLGADPSFHRSGSISAIHFAACFNKPSLLARLLQFKKDDYFNIPYSLSYSVIDILNRYVNSNKKDLFGATPLVIAADVGDKEKVEELVKYTNLLFTDELGNTPLMLASWNGSLDIVEILIKAGVLIDTQNIEGLTALMLAACFGHIKVVERLLEAGAKVNIKSRFGDSALGLAIKRGNENIKKLLVDHGAFCK